DKGGIVGVSIFTPGMPKGNDSTVEDYIASIEHMIALVGEDHVGIGTDFSQGHARPGPFQEWANRDKGYARVLTPFGTAKILKPRGIETIKEFPAVTEAMMRAGWKEQRILKVLGANWLRVLDEVWSV
ncbi:MAG: dipeptidase, partial [Rhodospirillales bacterium]|nr:dipeptidase [Rhodospirillales bacterium]